MAVQNDPRSSRRRGAAWRDWLALAVVILPSVLTSIDSTVLQLAAPHLSAALHPSGAQLLWIFDSYGLVTTCLLIPMGAVADRLGRRRVLLTGVALFGVASALAAFADSVEMLIAARGLMGLAAGALLPSTLSLISVIFDDDSRRAKAIAIWLGGSMFGMVIGPLVGGLMLQFFWWGSVFLLGIPVMGAVLVLGPLLLPEYRAAGSRRLDLVSMALVVLAVVSFTYGAQDLGSQGPAWHSALYVAVGLVLAALFVRRQRRIASPILDVGLFANRRFSVVVGVMAVAAIVISGGNFFIAQLLQSVLSLSPVAAGLAMAPAAFAGIAGYLVSPPLQERLPISRLIAVGVGLAALGMALFCAVSVSHGVWLIVVGGVVISVGLGLTIATCANVILGTASSDKAGQASAVQELSSQLGVVLGVALLGTLGTAVYGALVTRRLPAGTPNGIADAARSTIGAAVALAGSRGVSSQVAVVARQAFIDAFRIAATVSTVTLVGLAVIAALTLRRPASEDVERVEGQEPAEV